MATATVVYQVDLVNAATGKLIERRESSTVPRVGQKVTWPDGGKMVVSEVKVKGDRVRAELEMFME